MKGVLRKTTFCQLALVVAVDEELEVLHQRLHTTSETARFASQAFEVMAQVCIHRLYGVGFFPHFHPDSRSQRMERRRPRSRARTLHWCAKTVRVGRQTRTGIPGCPPDV